MEGQPQGYAPTNLSEIRGIVGVGFIPTPHAHRYYYAIMPYDPSKHHRRSIRLKGFDYASNASYFVTICTQNRSCLFGEISAGVMEINIVGQMITDEWLALPSRFSAVKLDLFVIMPNHFHGILSIDSSLEMRGVSMMPTPTSSTPKLGDVIRSFKSITTNRYTIGVRDLNWAPFDRRIWQRNYYEHIIRNDRSLEAIQNYINNNPSNWDRDELHPDAK